MITKAGVELLYRVSTLIKKPGEYNGRVFLIAFEKPIKWLGNATAVLTSTDGHMAAFIPTKTDREEFGVLATYVITKDMLSELSENDEAAGNRLKKLVESKIDDELPETRLSNHGALNISAANALYKNGYLTVLAPGENFYTERGYLHGSSNEIMRDEIMLDPRYYNIATRFFGKAVVNVRRYEVGMIMFSTGHAAVVIMEMVKQR